MKAVVSALFWFAGAFYAILLFSLLIAGVLIFPPEKLYPLARFMAKTQLLIMGVRMKIGGHKNFDRGKPYLIMGNHQSLFDVFAIPAALPMFFVGVGAKYHFSWPVWGYLIKKWGTICIIRSEKEKAVQALRKAEDVFKSGVSVLILPEGHRTLTGKIGEFKKGPFHLALAAKVDILPFVFAGLYEYNNKHSWRLNPGKISVVFGRPIPYESFKNMSVDEIRDRTRNIMLRLEADASGNLLK